MPSFLHGGDLGDVIYALPAIRAAGGGVLYLTDQFAGREPLDKARRKAIIPLLESIDYVEAVRLHKSEPIDYDFTGFRKRYRPTDRNLAEMQLEHFGFGRELAARPWIDRKAFRDHTEAYPLVMHRSGRYHNPIARWDRIAGSFGRDAVFIGFAREYIDFARAFGTLFYRPTGDLLEMARLIAACDIFVGNQSVGFALAQAMHVPSVLEVYPAAPDCHFEREHLYEIINSPIDLRWMEQRLRPPQSGGSDSDDEMP
jgi:hypothetical protein